MFSSPLEGCNNTFWRLLRLNHSFSNLLMSCKVTCLPPMTRWLEWEWDSRDSLTGQCLPDRTVDTEHKPQPDTRPSSSSRWPGCSFQTHPGIVWYTIAASEEAEMPGIIDDQVGHVIYPCKTAQTFSHLPLRGIVPPPPFRLIIKSHCYLRTTFFMCHYLHLAFIGKIYVTCRGHFATI